jgi:alpha-glucoside transport system permease protein
MDRLILALIVVVGVPAATVLYVAAVEWILGRVDHSIRVRFRPWLWILPALILLTFYMVYPVIITIYNSFHNANLTQFVGLANYEFAFTSSAMLQAFRNNLLWLVIFTAGTVLLGLLIAVLLDRVKYEPYVKSIIFLPMAISYVAAGVIWRLMYEYRPPNRVQTGTVNAILDAVIPGFEPTPWLVNTDWNNIALIVIGIWMWTGFAMVILSSGLKSIPDEIMEAGRVDGGNEYQLFFYIMLPMLQSTIAVVITTMVINVLKVFDIVYVLTNGNLGTDVIANRMYKEMFNFRNFGRASAIAVILFLAVVPVMIYNIRRFREQEATR